MLMKKYQAETEKEALELARNELGKDVLITHIKRIKPKGVSKLFKKEIVEITAAVDEDKKYEKKLSNSFANSFKPTLNETQQTSAFDVRIASEAYGEQNLNKKNNSAIEQKLDTLSTMIEKQLGGHEIPVEKQPVKELPEVPKSMSCVQMIYNQLIANEVKEEFANKVLSEIEDSIKPDSTVDMVLSSIYQKIVLKLGEAKPIDPITGKKCIIFIGPTGVGKTTTIAKIASSMTLDKENKKKVALITADTYRIKADEQLGTYARILNIPLRVVYSADELKNAVEESSDTDVILIDTAGRSHKNKDQVDDLEQIIHAVPENMRDVYLVLSATTKYKDLAKITETYSMITKYNIIFTKLDETACLGNILNIKMLTDAPLSYTTFGQKVPYDISCINPQNIAKQLLGGSR